MRPIILAAHVMTFMTVFESEMRAWWRIVLVQGTIQLCGRYQGSPIVSLNISRACVCPGHARCTTGEGLRRIEY